MIDNGGHDVDDDHPCPCGQGHTTGEHGYDPDEEAELARLDDLAEGRLMTCRHCDRRIVMVDGGWVDPEAENDDIVWRETCDAHDTFVAEHEPAVVEKCGTYRFVAEGIVEGVEYVTVLDAGGDPMEYNIPISQAMRDYGSPA